jgi:hypothetical protein
LKELGVDLKNFLLKLKNIAEKHENDCSNLKDIAKAVGLNKQRESQVNECYRRYSFK